MFPRFPGGFSRPRLKKRWSPRPYTSPLPAYSPAKEKIYSKQRGGGCGLWGLFVLGLVFFVLLLYYRPNRGTGLPLPGRLSHGPKTSGAAPKPPPGHFSTKGGPKVRCGSVGAAQRTHGATSPLSRRKLNKKKKRVPVRGPNGRKSWSFASAGFGAAVCRVVFPFRSGGGGGFSGRVPNSSVSGGCVCLGGGRGPRRLWDESGEENEWFPQTFVDEAVSPKECSGRPRCAVNNAGLEGDLGPSNERQPSKIFKGRSMTNDRPRGISLA